MDSSLKWHIGGFIAVLLGAVVLSRGPGNQVFRMTAVLLFVIGALAVLGGFVLSAWQALGSRTE